MRTPIVTVGHVGLAVRDLDVALDFYMRVVGLELTERFTYPAEAVGHGTSVVAGAFVRCDANHHCLSLFSPKDGSADDPSPRYGLHHLAFELGTPADLLAKHREVRELGVEIASARKGGPGNQPRFYIHDPDGNQLEFYWGIDQIGWQGTARAYPPIQEIVLEEFDFDAYIAARGDAAR